MHPRVTVAIPTHERAELLSGAIESALAQTYERLEVLVVDNASADGTRVLLEGFARRFPERFRFVINGSNVGMQGNFTRCVELARGEFLKIWCSDDLAHHTLVERQVAALDEDPTAVACTAYRRRQTDSVLFRWYDVLLRLRPGRWEGPAVVRKVFRVANLIGGPIQVLVRREALLRRMPFRDDPIVGDMFDVEPLLRLLAEGAALQVLGQTLCDYNSRATSHTTAALGRSESQRFFFDFRREQAADPVYARCLSLPGDLETSKRNAALLLSLAGFAASRKGSPPEALSELFAFTREHSPGVELRLLQAALGWAARVTRGRIQPG